MNCKRFATVLQQICKRLTTHKIYKTCKDLQEIQKISKDWQSDLQKFFKIKLKQVEISLNKLIISWN